MVVMPDANLDKAVDGLMGAAFDLQEKDVWQYSSCSGWRYRRSIS